MGNNKKRYLPHFGSALWLIAFVPWAKAYGVIAVTALVLALGFFIISGFIKPEAKEPRDPYEISM
ncbi:hypothetical protein [Dyella choica]|uniref:Uncharacterized protein n=1 Tax=Dyella choica TaxID=1927959 RepID=A0A3S0WW17_9GAMM|nr:hypothetical protein [Dyella choica]RUL75974.1 hypothetical protein EKH80_09635 [Dyella choica]